MSHACTPILVGMASSLLEIILPLKNGQISISGMDYSPWSSKKLIDRNWLKIFMQVRIDVTCMHTNFGGHGLFAFGDNITSQKRPNFPMVIKKFNRLELAQKIHASRG